ncbi:MAG: TolC family protein [Candidatus Omnitrophota bacterium]|nr:TolC family protein [Candidatus Omnitrophota bacterium]
MPVYRKIFTLVIIFSSVFFHPAAAEETLNWEECIREAAKHHPDLIAAQEIVQQSVDSKTITASTLFPQINSNLNASTARTDSGTTHSTKDAYSYGLTGTQLIFDGIKTINNVNAASENIKAAKENFRFTSTTVRYRLRSAFISLLTAQEMLRITREIFDIRRGNLELITLRYESGLEHKGALLTAEADLAHARYDISQAERNMEVTQRNLTKEMGRAEFVPMAAKGDWTVRDAAKDKPDFVALAKNNPSLQKLIAQKNAAEFGIKSAYGNFAPALNGQAGVNKTNSKWPANNDQWNLGLTVSMPIFEGGLRFAQVSQAKALADQLRENARSTRDSLVSTLEQTWASLQDTMDFVKVRQKYLIATEERSKIAQAQYAIGYITFDNWTIIENDLVTAKKNFLNAQAAMLLAEAGWIQAKGETLEYAQ